MAPIADLHAREILDSRSPDDEHRKRQRTCRQQRRLSGVHDPSGGRRQLFRALRYGVELFHVLKKVLHTRGSPRRSGMRAPSQD